MVKATKKLIIVCDEKTEQYANYLRQLISTNDDKDGEVVGIADGTVEAAVWLEKEYLANKAQISSNEHILFIGDNKTSKSESSSMVVKFEKYGMQYGWLGKRAMMKVDNEMLEPESYDEFIEYALGYQSDFEKIAMKRAKTKAIEKTDEPEVVDVQTAEEVTVEVKRSMDLIEIKGKINTAICYARVVEDEAIEQIRRMCDYPMTEGSRIRIMPDVHSGKGCTIGTTMTITDKAVPNVVGVDIGCGMYTVNLGKVDIDFVKVDEAAHFIPSGMNVWEGRQERFDLTELACYRELKDTKRLERSLGTLGGGNHFIEIDEAGDGTKYLVIHSGSRNLGKQVAELYQKLAINLDRGYGDYLEKRDEIIRTYKEQGRRSEIQDALKQLHWQVYESETSMPEDLCYLSGKYLEDYLHDVEICQAFARRSREKMAEIILERTGMTGGEAFHTIHNYIDTDEMILRKGAIAAHSGEKVLIPINMRDGSVLAVGKGNPEWNYSAPHGAGRLMSRTKAKANLSMDEYRETMKGIYTTSINENTLDEAPMAYKSLEDIIDVIRESVDVIDVMKPIYNFKASD